VGTIFHNKVSGALQERKRRFAAAKAALISSGCVKVVERNLAQYFELLK
jgi:predicted transcriptional regulator with HTH domain